MCGIAGIVGSKASAERLKAMLGCMKHRGEEAHFAEMTCIDGYAFGTNRLAIVDSSHGKQPFATPEGAVYVVNNGEIYNDLALRQRFKNAYAYQTACDTETVLAAYVSEGIEGLRLLEGMYGTFVLDRTHSTWFLTRDHLGIKPLYYGTGAGGTFYFASEMKAFSILHDVATIEALPPGAIMQGGRVTQEKKPYIFATTSDPGDAAALGGMRQHLEEAVRKMLPPSGETVACLLSGGVDSSTVTYLTHKLHGGNAVAYTFHNTGAPSKDYEAAQKLCATLGIKLVTVSPSIEDLSRFYVEKGVWMTETFETPLVRNAVSYHFLCRKVQEDGFKFCLSGEGADEVFGGYDYFRRLPEEERDHAIETSLAEISRTYLQMADRSSMFATLEVRVPYMDESVVSFATALPQCYRLRGTDNKWILRHLYNEILPPEICTRAKLGMNPGAGYGSNDPGESIYYKAIEEYYRTNSAKAEADRRLADQNAMAYDLDRNDIEVVYNFCRFVEAGFVRHNKAKNRPQLNTTGLVKMR